MGSRDVRKLTSGPAALRLQQSAGGNTQLAWAAAMRGGDLAMAKKPVHRDSSNSSATEELVQHGGPERPLSMPPDIPRASRGTVANLTNTNSCLNPRCKLRALATCVPASVEKTVAEPDPTWPKRGEIQSGRLWNGSEPSAISAIPTSATTPTAGIPCTHAAQPSSPPKKPSAAQEMSSGLAVSSAVNIQTHRTSLSRPAGVLYVRQERGSRAREKSKLTA